MSAVLERRSGTQRAKDLVLSLFPNKVPRYVLEDRAISQEAVAARRQLNEEGGQIFPEEVDAERETYELQTSASLAFNNSNFISDAFKLGHDLASRVSDERFEKIIRKKAHDSLRRLGLARKWTPPKSISF